MCRKLMIGISIVVAFIIIFVAVAWYVTGGSLRQLSFKNSELFQDTSAEVNTVSRLYDNRNSGYSIKYPLGWSYDDKSVKGAVIMRGKEGTDSYNVTVNIQTVLTKKTGGKFTTVKEFIDDMKAQAKSQALGPKYLESGPITFNEPNGSIVKGEYLILTYKLNNVDIKQWQIVVLRNDDQVFYAWAYTAPANLYDKELPVAKRILESWSIY